MKGKKTRHRFCMWLLCMSRLIPYTLPPIYLAYIPILARLREASYKPGLSVSHTYSFVFDQIVSNWGAAIILLDNIHFNGVSIFSHLTFQLGRAGFPWNNGGFMFKIRECTNENQKNTSLQPFAGISASLWPRHGGQSVSRIQIFPSLHPWHQQKTELSFARWFTTTPSHIYSWGFGFLANSSKLCTHNLQRMVPQSQLRNFLPAPFLRHLS